MAVLVFSGGHTLRVPMPPEAAADALTAESGLIPMAWKEMRSGDGTALVNPHQVAYIAGDNDIVDSPGA